MTILLQIPQQLKTSWFTVTAFIGLSLIILIVLVISLDSIRIRSNINAPHKRLRRKQRKKQEKQEDLLNLSQKANFGSDFNLPSDYVISMSCSSGYGSTRINETIKEEEEEEEKNFQDQSDKEQAIETEHPLEHITTKHILKE